MKHLPSRVNISTEAISFSLLQQCCWIIKSEHLSVVQHVEGLQSPSCFNDTCAGWRCVRQTVSKTNGVKSKAEAEVPKPECSPHVQQGATLVVVERLQVARRRLLFVKTVIKGVTEEHCPLYVHWLTINKSESSIQFVSQLHLSPCKHLDNDRKSLSLGLHSTTVF